MTEKEITALENLAKEEAKLYKRLLDFLYGLDAEKFPASPSRLIAAEQVLVKLAASGEIETFDRAASYLAPLFSSTPEQRKSFDRKFKEWNEDLKKEVKQKVSAAENQSAAEEAALLIGESDSVVASDSPTDEAALEKVSRRAKRLWRDPQTLVQIVLLVFFLAVTAILFQPKIQQIINPPPTPTASPITPPPTPNTATGGNVPAPVANFYYLLLVAAIVFPFLVWLLWLAWWQLWRKPYLKKWLDKKKKDENLNFKRPRADKSGGELYEAAEVRRFAQELRRHRRLPTAVLDPDATVTASVARIGFFTPVYDTRRVSPEYLVLIDRAGYQDQQAHLIDEWLERLKAAGVFVERYYYDGDPQLCRAAVDVPLNPETLFSFHALASSYADYRLLIFGEPQSFVEINLPSPLLTLLMENWRVRVLLSTAPAENFAERVVRAEGLPVFRADEENLDLLLAAIRQSEDGEDDEEAAAALINDVAPAAPPYYPTLLLENEPQWVEEAAPAKPVAEVLKGELRLYLGDEGYRLLAACAVYPEVIWDLTFYLAHHLLERDGREAALARFVRLPWFRYSEMPDWLRLELLEDLSEAEQKQLRELLERMFISYLEHPAQGFTLDLHQPSAPNLIERIRKWNQRRRFYDLIKIEYAAGILREKRFADFLAQRKFSVRLARRLKNYAAEKKETALAAAASYLQMAVELFRKVFYKNGNPLNRVSQWAVVLIPATVSVLVALAFFKLPDRAAQYAAKLPDVPAFESLSGIFPTPQRATVRDPSATPDPSETPDASPSPVDDPTPGISPPPNDSPSPSLSPTATVQPSPTANPLNPPGTCNGNDLTAADGYAIRDIGAYNSTTKRYAELNDDYPVGPKYIGKIFSPNVLSDLRSDAASLLMNLGIKRVNSCVIIHDPEKCLRFNSKCVDILLEGGGDAETPPPTAEPTVTAEPTMPVTPTPDATPTPAPLSPTPTTTPTAPPTLTPTATPAPPLTIESMTITYYTGDNPKEVQAIVQTRLKLNDNIVGAVSGTLGARQVWEKNTKQSAQINLSRSILYEQCSDLSISVNKTGRDQWNVSFSVKGILSDGQSVELLSPSKIYKLGDNDDFSWVKENLKCPSVEPRPPQIK